MKTLVTFLCTVLAVMIFNSNVMASHRQIPFAEIAQTADMIFVGEVVHQESSFNQKGTMITTDVTFENINVIASKKQSVQKANNSVVLSYAGGQIGDISLSVCGMPHFENGQHYLILLLDDGKHYMNPIVGDYQGIFIVEKDEVTGMEYMLSADGRSIVDLSMESIMKNGYPVKSIRNSIIRYDEGKETKFSGHCSNSNCSNHKNHFQNNYSVSDENVNPVTLDEFTQFITQQALTHKLKKRFLNIGGKGKFYKRNNRKIDTVEIPISKSFSSKNESYKTNPNFSKALNKSLNNKITKKGATRSSAKLTFSPMIPSYLHAYRVNSPIVIMEQAAQYYNINEDCMISWNEYMGMFNFSEDDGTYGYNAVNEFCGFVTAGDLNSVYSRTWGGRDALCIAWSVLGQIVESDILLNPSSNWTTDLDVAVNSGGSILLVRSVIMHELGHVLGFITYLPEINDYGVLSVMNTPTNVVEDGWGLHAADAQLLRLHYADEGATLKYIYDIGVESYYAQIGAGTTGLLNSEIHDSGDVPETQFRSGEEIILKNVTLENIGNLPIAEGRLRFYLTKDRTIDESEDIEIADIDLGTITPESYSVEDYVVIIPDNVSPDTFFIGAKVTMLGYDDDQFPENSTTTFMNAITVNILPNLIVDDESEGMNDLPPSGFQVFADIKNDGNAPTSSLSEVKFYASKDENINTTDILLATEVLGILDVDEISSESTSTLIYEIYIPCEAQSGLVMTPGEYHLGIIIDPNDQVKELDESDNTFLISSVKLIVPERETNYHRAYNLPNDFIQTVHTEAIEVVQNAADNTAFITTGWHKPEGHSSTGLPLSRELMQIIAMEENKDVAWAKTYLAEGDNFADMRAYDIKELGVGNNTDDGYITCGELLNAIGEETMVIGSYIMKVDAEGEVDWMRRYYIGTSSGLTSIVPAVSGDGYLACGYYVSDEEDGYLHKAFLLKVDLNGNVDWASGISDAGMEDGAHSVYNQIIIDDTEAMSVPTYYLVGTCNLSYNYGCDNTSEVLFSRVDETSGGPVIINTSYSTGGVTLPNGVRMQFGSSITTGPENQLYIGGQYQVDYQNGGGDCVSAPVDLLLLNITNTGGMNWSKRYKVPGKNYTNDILHVRGLNEVVITGKSGNDAFMMSADLEGTPLRTELIWDDVDTPNEGRSLARNPYNGRYLFVGGAQIFSPDFEDMFLFERNPIPVDELDRCCDDYITYQVQNRTQITKARQKEMHDVSSSSISINAFDLYSEDILKCGANDPSCAIYDYDIAINDCNDDDSAIDSTDDFALAEITLYYTNEPETNAGYYLSVTGAVSTASTSNFGFGSQTFTDIEIPADGESKELIASFINEPGCELGIVVPPVYPCSCGAPLDSWVTNITFSSAKIYWTPIEGAIKYRLHYRKAGVVNPWKNKFVTNPWKLISALDSNTEYEYKLKTKCSDGWTDWSPLKYFTTYSSFTEEVDVRTIDSTETTFDTFSEVDMEVYPNPTAGNLNLNVRNAEPDSELLICNILGKTKKTILVENETEKLILDLSDLPTGTYFVRLESESESIVRKVILINN